MPYTVTDITELIRHHLVRHHPGLSPPGPVGPRRRDRRQQPSPTGGRIRGSGDYPALVGRRKRVGPVRCVRRLGRSRTHGSDWRWAPE